MSKCFPQVAEGAQELILSYIVTRIFGRASRGLYSSWVGFPPDPHTHTFITMAWRFRGRYTTTVAEGVFCLKA